LTEHPLSPKECLRGKEGADERVISDFIMGVFERPGNLKRIRTILTICHTPLAHRIVLCTFGSVFPFSGGDF
jgi:hypothetical protein